MTAGLERDVREPVPFPFDAPVLYEPPPTFGALRESEPVRRIQLPTGDLAWLVTRYDDVRLVLSDPRFSRAAASVPEAPRLRPLPPDPSTILAKDPPEHTRLRTLVARAFSARRIETLRGFVEDVVGRLLDDVAAAGPPADLVPALALPLPVTVIGQLLGVPAGDLPVFRGWADVMLTLTGHSRDEIRAARVAMNDYLRELIASHRRDPGEDLLSALAKANDDDRLSEEELVVFGATLLVAGYHTTSTALTAAVVLLMRERPAYRRLAADPSSAEATVEEILRYAAASTHGSNLRVATERVELGGVTIEPGDGVLAAIISANRDGSVFADADRFDPSRPRNPHLTFGQGPHFCLGAQLARLELAVALRVLATRFPGLALAVATDELQINPGDLIRRLTALPVRW